MTVAAVRRGIFALGKRRCLGVAFRADAIKASASPLSAAFIVCVDGRVCQNTVKGDKTGRGGDLH